MVQGRVWQTHILCKKKKRMLQLWLKNLYRKERRTVLNNIKLLKVILDKEIKYISNISDKPTQLITFENTIF